MPTTVKDEDVRTPNCRINTPPPGFQVAFIDFVAEMKAIFKGLERTNQSICSTRFFPNALFGLDKN
jgi:hypothetical protein